MRDPHIHVERTPAPGFGSAAMRAVCVEALGVAFDLPKTVGTGCGRRRPIAMTSTVPEHVTCVACRDYARLQYLQGMADAAAGLADDAGLAASMAREGKRLLSRADCEARAREYRDLSARYA